MGFACVTFPVILFGLGLLFWAFQRVTGKTDMKLWDSGSDSLADIFDPIGPEARAKQKSRDEAEAKARWEERRAQLRAEEETDFFDRD